ncbi:hypothetical protein GCM10027176_44800 [Actinoallomurus bryophytorum]|uniref:Uncharacterized protein n=1 Tax=Actinoallomurus bryophytorum TaxID=1490222 RepID=A0A543BSP6_9ACTN|nr:hypothetical protein [Actinoallomurus bryophytorum]TQL87864.1 hypothetical protein FB559_8475 [Actinoallomurus bryophytorum]
MAEWEIRKDGTGDLVSVHDDRVGALARALVLRATTAHAYRVTGPPGPVCATGRDLYLRLVDSGREMQATDRTLGEFLRAWWSVGRLLADRERLEPDTVAAMIAASATVEPPPMRAAWRETPHEYAPEPSSYSDWERIVLSQITDLADLADAGPLPPDASFGLDVPRPAGSVRATGERWYNFDPAGYLECGAAGAFGGWDEAGGTRVAVPGPATLPTAEADGVRALGALHWGDLARLAVCGQVYE